jgi:hypothetical protein
MKPIKFLKKLNGSVRFCFLSLKPKKLSRTEPKPSQTEKTEQNRKKPSQTGLSRFLS